MEIKGDSNILKRMAEKVKEWEEETGKKATEIVLDAGEWEEFISELHGHDYEPASLTWWWIGVTTWEGLKVRREPEMATKARKLSCNTYGIKVGDTLRVGESGDTLSVTEVGKGYIMVTRDWEKEGGTGKESA